MKHLIFLSLVLAGCSAAADGYSVIVENGSATAFDNVTAYGTDGYGQPVEDNLGFAVIAIAPGASGSLALPGLSRCAEVWLRAQDASGQAVATGAVDLCKSTTITLSEMLQ